MSKIKGLVLLVAVTGVGIAACFLLILAANYFTGYVIRGTRPIPGDAAKYDPIAIYPQIAAFAGGNVQLLRMDMKFVKADGTLDLTANYGAEVEYDFARVLDTPPTNAAPLGAGGNPSGTYAERINVTVSQPGTKGGSKNQYYDFGMDRNNIPASSLSTSTVSAPNCNLKDLWDIAIKQDAPGNAVATIHYDTSGYSFAISGTKIYLQFDANCQLKN